MYARRRPHRGATSTGMIATLAGLGVIVGAAALFGPRYLVAGESPPVPVAARQPEHQQVLQLLAGLIGRSHRILAIDRRTTSPFYEIVLWLEDVGEAGVIEAGEIAVVSHSAVAHTIELWTLQVPTDDDADEPPVTFTVDALSRPGFGSRLRSLPRASRRVIARGVSVVQVGLAETADEGRSLVEISLTWAGNPVDGPDKASAFIDVGSRFPRAARGDDQEH